jgi:hypothetical protein
MEEAKECLLEWSPPGGTSLGCRCVCACVCVRVFVRACANA